MDMIRKVNEKKAISRQKFKEAEENMKIHRMLEERQKSANRRELERHMKEQEEANIKQTLDTIRTKQQRDVWSGKNSIMNQEMNILKNDKPILKEKNIFMDNKNKIPLAGRGMFFK